MTDLPRWTHRLYARLRGYYWLACPACGRDFGGHEAGDCSRAGWAVCGRCVDAFACCGGVEHCGRRWHVIRDDESGRWLRTEATP